MHKPVIRKDPFDKKYRCVSVEELPEERCFITGKGDSPRDSFNDWVVASELFIKYQLKYFPDKDQIV
ncbi:hypothetical protein [Hafnia paralvei]|uniref:hypothetical protein n=1 Tax=Hafnia paralvei TaxID=546367 RepID=UPI00241EEEA3|nr:hypothetical protein [Hafnia paralvei]